MNFARYDIIWITNSCVDTNIRISKLRLSQRAMEREMLGISLRDKKRNKQRFLNSRRTDNKEKLTAYGKKQGHNRKILRQSIFSIENDDANDDDDDV